MGTRNLFNNKYDFGVDEESQEYKDTLTIANEFQQKIVESVGPEYLQKVLVPLKNKLRSSLMEIGNAQSTFELPVEINNKEGLVAFISEVTRNLNSQFNIYYKFTDGKFSIVITNENRILPEFVRFNLPHLNSTESKENSKDVASRIVAETAAQHQPGVFYEKMKNWGFNVKNSAKIAAQFGVSMGSSMIGLSTLNAMSSYMEQFGSYDVTRFGKKVKVIDKLISNDTDFTWRHAFTNKANGNIELIDLSDEALKTNPGVYYYRQLILKDGGLSYDHRVFDSIEKMFDGLQKRKIGKVTGFNAFQKRAVEIIGDKSLFAEVNSVLASEFSYDKMFLQDGKLDIQYFLNFIKTLISEFKDSKDLQQVLGTQFTYFVKDLDKETLNSLNLNVDTNKSSSILNRINKNSVLKVVADGVMATMTFTGVGSVANAAATTVAGVVSSVMSAQDKIAAKIYSTLSNSNSENVDSIVEKMTKETSKDFLTGALIGVVARVLSTNVGLQTDSVIAKNVAQQLTRWPALGVAILHKMKSIAKEQGTNYRTEGSRIKALINDPSYRAQVLNSIKPLLAGSSVTSQIGAVIQRDILNNAKAAKVDIADSQRGFHTTLQSDQNLKVKSSTLQENLIPQDLKSDLEMGDKPDTNYPYFDNLPKTSPSADPEIKLTQQNPDSVSGVTGGSAQKEFNEYLANSNKLEVESEIQSQSVTSSENPSMNSVTETSKAPAQIPEKDMNGWTQVSNRDLRILENLNSQTITPTVVQVNTVDGSDKLGQAENQSVLGVQRTLIGLNTDGISDSQPEYFVDNNRVSGVIYTSLGNLSYDDISGDSKIVYTNNGGGIQPAGIIFGSQLATGNYDPSNQTLSVSYRGEDIVIYYENGRAVKAEVAGLERWNPVQGGIAAQVAPVITPSTDAIPAGSIEIGGRVRRLTNILDSSTSQLAKINIGGSDFIYGIDERSVIDNANSPGVVRLNRENLYVAFLQDSSTPESSDGLVAGFVDKDGNAKYRTIGSVEQNGVTYLQLVDNTNNTIFAAVKNGSVVTISASNGVPLFKIDDQEVSMANVSSKTFANIATNVVNTFGEDQLEKSAVIDVDSDTMIRKIGGTAILEEGGIDTNLNKAEILGQEVYFTGDRLFVGQGVNFQELSIETSATGERFFVMNMSTISYHIKEEALSVDNINENIFALTFPAQPGDVFNRITNQEILGIPQQILFVDDSGLIIPVDSSNLSISSANYSSINVDRETLIKNNDKFYRILHSTLEEIDVQTKNILGTDYLVFESKFLNNTGLVIDSDISDGISITTVSNDVLTFNQSILSESDLTNSYDYLEKISVENGAASYTVVKPNLIIDGYVVTKNDDPNSATQSLVNSSHKTSSYRMFNTVTKDFQVTDDDKFAVIKNEGSDYIVFENSTENHMFNMTTNTEIPSFEISGNKFYVDESAVFRNDGTFVANLNSDSTIEIDGKPYKFDTKSGFELRTPERDPRLVDADDIALDNVDTLNIDQDAVLNRDNLNPQPEIQIDNAEDNLTRQIKEQRIEAEMQRQNEEGINLKPGIPQPAQTEVDEIQQSVENTFDGKGNDRREMSGILENRLSITLSDLDTTTEEILVFDLVKNFNGTKDELALAIDDILNKQPSVNKASQAILSMKNNQQIFPESAYLTQILSENEIKSIGEAGQYAQLINSIKDSTGNVDDLQTIINTYLNPEVVETQTATTEPTSTSTSEATPTITQEPTLTQTATTESSATATNTETAQPTLTETIIPPTETSTLTDVPTETNTSTPTAEPTLTNTDSPTFTSTPEPTITETLTPTVTNTEVPLEGMDLVRSLIPIPDGVSDDNELFTALSQSNILPGADLSDLPTDKIRAFINEVQTIGELEEKLGGLIIKTRGAEQKLSETIEDNASYYQYENKLYRISPESIPTEIIEVRNIGSESFAFDSENSVYISNGKAFGYLDTNPNDSRLGFLILEGEGNNIRLIIKNPNNDGTEAPQNRFILNDDKVYFFNDDSGRVSIIDSDGEFDTIAQRSIKPGVDGNLSIELFGNTSEIKFNPDSKDINWSETMSSLTQDENLYEIIKNSDGIETGVVYNNNGIVRFMDASGSLKLTSEIADRYEIVDGAIKLKPGFNPLNLLIPGLGITGAGIAGVYGVKRFFSNKKITENEFIKAISKIDKDNLKRILREIGYNEDGEYLEFISDTDRELLLKNLGFESRKISVTNKQIENIIRNAFLSESDDDVKKVNPYNEI